uniref:Fibronectin type-III domain-containing protein n=1 Tax=Haemonchus contortus TaxID=6289 RepID=A0A7I4XWD9_HAECO
MAKSTYRTTVLFSLLWMSFSEELQKKDFVVILPHGDEIVCDQEFQFDERFDPYYRPSHLVTKNRTHYKLSIKDEDFPYGKPFMCGDIEYRVYTIPESQVLPQFSAKAVQERPRHISIEFTQTKYSFVPGRSLSVVIFCIPRHDGSYFKYDTLPAPIKSYVNNYVARECHVVIDVSYMTAIINGHNVQKQEEIELEPFPALEPMEVIILEHQGALRYYDYQPFQIVWRVENVLPTENVRDFSMTVHLMRTNRSDLYFYSDTTKNDSEITRSEHDESIFEITYYPDQQFESSMYDIMKMTITPIIESYKGKSGSKIYSMGYNEIGMSRMVVKIKSIVSLSCLQFTKNESECFWEMLSRDSLHKNVDRPRNFLNGTEIPEMDTLSLVIDFYDSAFFYCYVRRTLPGELHRKTTFVEVIPLRDDQLKPNISVEVVEERPRHIIIMWNYSVPEIAKEKRVLLTRRVETTGQEHTIFVDDELNGSETLNVDNEKREYNIVVATAFTDAPDVGGSVT